MIIDKTKFGLPLFDDLFGGVYRDRMTLCCGKYGSGKSMFGAYFLNQGISDNDNSLLLTVHSAEDVIIIGECLGFPFAQAVDSGSLTILEYNSFISDQNVSDNALLPPDAFLQLEKIIESKSIRRIVFDSVIPWVAITPPARIPEHVFSFSRAISRLHMTTLLTLPKPVSVAARTLKNRLEDVCPISIGLDKETDGRQTMNVTKYVGQVEFLSTPIPFSISPREGISPLPAASAVPPAAMAPGMPPPSPAHAAPPPKREETAPREDIPVSAIAEGLPFPFPPPPIGATVPPSPRPPLPGGAPLPPAGRPRTKSTGGRIAFSDAIKFPSA